MAWVSLSVYKPSQLSVGTSQRARSDWEGDALLGQHVVLGNDIASKWGSPSFAINQSGPNLSFGWLPCTLEDPLSVFQSSEAGDGGVHPHILPALEQQNPRRIA